MDQVNVTPTEPQEDPKHEEAMIKKADGDATEDTPQLLAGKYQTEEDLQQGVLELLKHQNKEMTLEDIYKNLSSLTKPPQEDTQAPPPTEDGDTEKSTELDFSPYFEELQTEGSLSEDSYKTLESQGFNKDFVDSYVEGQKALAERENKAFYDTVGGQENYTAMTEWASLNLDEAEINAFNDAINTNLAVAKLATEALYGRFKTAKGEPPKNPIQGNVTATGASGGVYESLQQMTADMAKPEYERDPAFRRMVQEKLSRSKIL